MDGIRSIHEAIAYRDVGKGREQDAEALPGMRKLCRGAEALRAAIFCEIVARKQTLTVVLAARLKIL